MPKKVLNFDFGKVKIYEHILEVIVNEGVVFDSQHREVLLELFVTYFENKNFGLLSNRLNDYSVNLDIRSKNSCPPNQVATAVVCYSVSSRKIAKFEKAFYKNPPFEVFMDYKQAVGFIKKLL